MYQLTKDLKKGDLIEQNLGEGVCIEVRKKWKPEKWEKYWTVGHDGTDYHVNNSAWNDDFHDRRRYLEGNCFRTEQEAEAHKAHLGARLELLEIVDELNEGWTPDWENGNEDKWYIYFEHGLDYFEATCANMSQQQNVYMKEDFLDTVLGRMGKGRLKLALNIHC